MVTKMMFFEVKQLGNLEELGCNNRSSFSATNFSF